MLNVKVSIFRCKFFNFWKPSKEVSVTGTYLININKLKTYKNNSSKTLCSIFHFLEAHTHILREGGGSGAAVGSRTLATGQWSPHHPPGMPQGPRLEKRSR